MRIVVCITAFDFKLQEIFRNVFQRVSFKRQIGCRKL